MGSDKEVLMPHMLKGENES